MVSALDALIITLLSLDPMNFMRKSLDCPWRATEPPEAKCFISSLSLLQYLGA